MHLYLRLHLKKHQIHLHCWSLGLHLELCIEQTLHLKCRLQMEKISENLLRHHFQLKVILLKQLRQTFALTSQGQL